MASAIICFFAFSSGFSVGATGLVVVVSFAFSSLIFSTFSFIFSSAFLSLFSPSFIPVFSLSMATLSSSFFIIASISAISEAETAEYPCSKSSTVLAFIKTLSFFILPIFSSAFFMFALSLLLPLFTIFLSISCSVFITFVSSPVFLAFKISSLSSAFNCSASAEFSVFGCTSTPPNSIVVPAL